MADDNEFLIEASLNVSSTVQNIQAQLKDVESQLKPINLDVKINSNKINSVQAQTVKVTKSTQDLSSQLDIVGNRAMGAYGNLQKYLNQNSQVAAKLPERINEIGASYQRVQEAINVGNLSKAKSSLQEMNSQVTALKGNARDMNIEGKTFGETITNDIGKISQWISSMTVFYAAINEVKQMITNVQELNKSMVNLQIASGYNNDQMSKLMDTYSQMGQNLGATTTEVADSADAWLRQGKSVEDSNALIKDSMMLSKLGEIDSAQATDYLTSAMKGYGVSVNDTIGIVDKLTKVDMVSATSAGGLAEGMSKTANAANIAGVSMDKLIGYLAVVGETTQKSMDEVGTSFQAIFSRMGNVKAGKFIKDSENDVNNVEAVLGKLGIKLRDSQGNFVNFGNVIDTIGSKWKTYSNLEQNAIATAVAGTRQRENFLVLMNNYNTALKYQETATNSAGTATQKYADYTQGLEAHVKSATAAFEQLSKTLINSDLFKGVVDTGTGFINTLNTIISKLGGIPTLISSISIAMSVMGKNNILTPFSSMSNISSAIPLIEKYTNNIALSAEETKVLDTAMKSASFDRYIEGLNGESASLGGYIKYMATAEAGTLALSAAQKVATMAAGALKAALNGIIVLGIVELIQLAVTGINNWINRVEIQKQKVNELSTAYEESKQKITDINTQLSDTQKKIDDLNSKKKLTFVEQDQLATLKETTKQLQLQADIAQKASDQKVRELGEAALTAYQTQFGNQNFNQNSINQYVKNAQSTGNNAILTSNTSDINQMIAAYKQFTDLKNKAFSAEDNEEVTRYNELLTNIKDSLNGDVSDLQKVQTALEKIPVSERSDDVKKALTDINKDIDLVYENIDPSKLKTINFNSIFNDKSLNTVVTQLNILSKQGKLTANTFNQPEFKIIAKSFSNAGISASQAANQINALNQKTSINNTTAQQAAKSNDDLASSLKGLSDSNVKNFNILQGVLNDVSKYKVLSSDDLSSLLKLSKAWPDLTSAILQYNAGIKSTASMTDLIKQKMQSLQSSYKKAISDALGDDSNYYTQKISKATSLINDLKEKYNIDYKNYTTFNQLKQAVSDAENAVIISKNGETIGQLASQYKADVNNFTISNDGKTIIFGSVLTQINTLSATQVDALANHYGIDKSNFKTAEDYKTAVAAEASKAMIAMNGQVATSMSDLLSKNITALKAAQSIENNTVANSLMPNSPGYLLAEKQAGDKLQANAKINALSAALNNIKSDTSGTTSSLESEIDRLKNSFNASIPDSSKIEKTNDVAGKSAKSAGDKATEAAKKAHEALENQYKSQLKIIEANKEMDKYSPDKYGVVGLQYYNALLALQNKYKNSQIDADDKAELASKVLQAHKDYEQSILDTSYSELETREKLGKVQENSKETLQNLLDIQKNLNTSGMSLVNTRANQLEIEEKIYDMEKQMREQDKSNINSLLTTTEDMLKKNFDIKKQQHSDRLDQIKKEKQAEKDKNDAALKAIKDQISLQQKQLEQEQNAYNHNEEQTDKEKAVANINAELVAIKNDTSDSAAAKRLALQDKLVDAEKELNDYEYSYSIDTQKNALSDLQNKYEKEYEAKNKQLEDEEKAQEDQLQKEINAIDKASQNEVAIREQAMKLINGKSQSFYNQLIAYNTAYGNGISQDISNAWDAAYQSLAHYGNGARDVLSTLQQLTKQMVGYSDASNLASSMATRHQSSIYPNGYYIVEKGDTLSKIADWFGLSLSVLESANHNIKKVSVGQKVLIPHYAEGTDNAVGGLAKVDDGVGTKSGLEDIFQPDGNGSYYILNRGAKVVTAENTNNLTQWGKFNPQDYTTLMQGQLKNLMSNAVVTNQNNNTPVSIEMPIVVNGTADESILNGLKSERNHIINAALQTLKSARINVGTVKSIYNT